MTMRYSHLLTEHLHAAVAKVGTKVGTATTVWGDAPGDGPR
jgi:hypothetical protein